jgi:hypothetical protein
LQFKNGDVYDGEWKDGQFDGYGTFVYAKSQAEDDEESMGYSQFKGTYKDGKRVEGTLRYENGDVYVGTFDADGMKECGVQRFENGDEYSGEFKNGARFSGIMKFKSGEVYSGDWLDGLFHGSGKIIYENGLKYQGEFQCGNKHGQG